MIPIEVERGWRLFQSRDMYFRDNDLRMEYVPVKTIWVRESPCELSFLTKTRLRGVQFGKLTQTQVSELERFLLLNTLTEEG
jgi:hypothetical protein